ncbi:MAG: hypothetical protein JWM71_1076, partial [Solirubrobacteraceae bacterium]|nr:hypothetical protein [Solirubrobacteraceae bacterium]
MTRRDNRLGVLAANSLVIALFAAYAVVCVVALRQSASAATFAQAPPAPFVLRPAAVAPKAQAAPNGAPARRVLRRVRRVRRVRRGLVSAPQGVSRRPGKAARRRVKLPLTTSSYGVDASGTAKSKTAKDPETVQSSTGGPEPGLEQVVAGRPSQPSTDAADADQTVSTIPTPGPVSVAPIDTGTISVNHCTTKTPVPTTTTTTAATTPAASSTSPTQATPAAAAPSTAEVASQPAASSTGGSATAQASETPAPAAPVPAPAAAAQPATSPAEVSQASPETAPASPEAASASATAAQAPDSAQPAPAPAQDQTAD